MEAAGEAHRTVPPEGGLRSPALSAADDAARARSARVHCVQLFHDLSDPGMEDLLYEVESVRWFAGLRLTGALPDEASPSAT